METTRELKLIAEKDGGRVLLLSPSVGLLSQAVEKNQILASGAPAGVLETLGVSYRLVAPAGAVGRVVTDRPGRVLEPVGYRTVLYELAPVEEGSAGVSSAEEAASATDGGLVFRAPYSGRFWHRPSPNDPPFVSDGDAVEEGETIGLIEVMKTFTHLHYAAEEGLPARAKIARVLVDDGGEVNAGDPILEIEPVG